MGCLNEWSPALAAETYATVAGILASAILVLLGATAVVGSNRVTSQRVISFAVVALVALMYAAFSYAVVAGDTNCTAGTVAAARAAAVLYFGAVAALGAITIQMLTSLAGARSLAARTARSATLLIAAVGAVHIISACLDAYYEVQPRLQWPVAVGLGAAALPLLGVAIWSVTTARRSANLLLVYLIAMLTLNMINHTVGARLPVERWSDSETIPLLLGMTLVSAWMAFSAVVHVCWSLFLVARDDRMSPQASAAANPLSHDLS